MGKSVRFQLNTTDAGRIVLQGMAMDIVTKSARAIAERANSVSEAISNEAPTFEVKSRVGTIKIGTRAIATVAANVSDNEHTNYVARTALLKSVDAGRVK